MKVEIQKRELFVKNGFPPARERGSVQKKED